jgi:hypothetical protein
MTPEAALTTLAAKHPLPDGWSRSEAVLDRFVADGLEVHRAGLCATVRGEEVNGAAVAVDGSPVARAWFELLERASTLEAMRNQTPELDLWTADGAPCGACAHDAVFPESSDPASFRYARSNGVAAHLDWPTACRRALWELAERDRVLRSWFGEIAPQRLELWHRRPLFERTRSYTWRAYRFPAEGHAAWSEGIEVVGLYGFPMERSAPLIFGYGARPALHDAFSSAVDEATQLLGFLWGEAIPEHEPALVPAAVYHLERFLVRDNYALLERWLNGEHLRFRACVGTTDKSSDASARFVDLTPRGTTSFKVAKALSAAALPLIFGVGPVGSHLPSDLRVHPIA